MKGGLEEIGDGYGRASLKNRLHVRTRKVLRRNARVRARVWGATLNEATGTSGLLNKKGNLNSRT